MKLIYWVGVGRREQTTFVVPADEVCAPPSLDITLAMPLYSFFIYSPILTLFLLVAIIFLIQTNVFPYKEECRSAVVIT